MRFDSASAFSAVVSDLWVPACRVARTTVSVLGVVAALSLAAPAQAQVTPFSQALAEAAAQDRDIAAVYRDRDFAPIWTGPSEEHAARRAALLTALEAAPTHGLPGNLYNVQALRSALSAVDGGAARADMEVRLSKLFLAYARDVQTGLLVPSSIDPGLVRDVQLRDRDVTLTGFAAAEHPNHFLRSLTPQTGEYIRLLKARMSLEHTIAAGGWGPSVPGRAHKPGESGSGVIALRNRMIAMGYLDRSAARDYDAALEKAVQAFQADHGLEPDGVAGAATLKAINTTPETRLKSIHVAMERERWLNRDRGDRHVLVNIADFSARVVDFDEVTFHTRAVVGKNMSSRRTPEFSDVMEHMVINPSWNVPRSITTNEYLPQLQNNPNAVGHLQVLDSRGRVVSRDNVDFASFTTRSFPFRLKQPPGRSNALGLVKFMFPNKHNIYLHDTPAKNLFAREVRAYSHGCVRLHQPFDFAYTLLAVQESDPKGYFHAVLDSGRETQVDLEQPIPVHITYRTAFTDAKGRVQYRNDIYGRDAAIWNALERAGVSLPGVQG